MFEDGRQRRKRANVVSELREQLAACASVDCVRFMVVCVDCG